MKGVPSRSTSNAMREATGSSSPGIPPPSALRRVVLATDGSPHSERAYAVAVKIAKASGAALEVLTVVPISPEYNIGAFAGAPPYVPDDESRRYYREIADRTKERAQKDGVKDVSVEVVEGSPGDLIVGESKELHADLIVLGARGLSTSARILLGSVSNTVATTSSIPALIVRGETVETSKGEASIDRVVAAVDGSPSSTRALDLAIELSRCLSLPLRIVTVVPVPSQFRGAAAKKDEAATVGEAEALVEKGRAKASNAGVTDVASEVLRGSPSDSLMSYLGDGPLHLLAVGSRGRSPSRSLLLGSVSTALLHHSPSSVLVARPSEIRASPAKSAKK